MFGENKDKFFKENKDSERSLISESVNIEGTLKSSGSIDIAGTITGPVFSKELVIKETGVVVGQVESEIVEINGKLEGKIIADNIVIGATGVVKGDIEFAQNLRTEDGADIDGYIKKTSSASRSESKMTGEFLFAKNKEEKKIKKNGKPSI